MGRRSPNILTPRRGPSAPTLASANPSAAQFGSGRDFTLSGVSTSARGIPRNPSLFRRRNPNMAPLRQQSGGAS